MRSKLPRYIAEEMHNGFAKNMIANRDGFIKGHLHGQTHLQTATVRSGSL